MSNNNQLTATCLCGAVRLTPNSVSRHVGACHCTTCRTWGGGPLMAVDCGTEVSIEGAEHISVYDSSDWAERGFCKRCGSHLFYRLKGINEYQVPVGLFAGGKDFSFDLQVFIDQKPAFYRFANDTEDMTAAEVFAKYAPPAE